MLGILTLDTAFPRIPGDLGSPETFAFPVRHAIVRGAGVDEIVHRRSEDWLVPFVDAARELAARRMHGDHDDLRVPRALAGDAGADVSGAGADVIAPAAAAGAGNVAGRQARGRRHLLRRRSG